MLSFASKCLLSATLKILKEEQSFKFLSKLFQIWTPLYANDRWPCIKSFCMHAYGYKFGLMCLIFHVYYYKY